jgi:hypothetical protein
MDQVVAANHLDEGRLRVTVTAGPGSLGSDRSERQPTVIVAGGPPVAWPAVTDVVVVPWPRNERGALAGLKTISYAENVRALARAAAAGAGEAIFANTRGELCEGTGTNVFYVVEGELTVRLGVEHDRLVATAGTLVLVPPLVVHGFLNASDADVFYLNFHAPGTGFAAYMRGLARGERVPFDQEPPPGDGVRPTSDIVVGHEIETPAIAIAEVTGAAPRGRFAYVLEGELAGSWIEDPPSDLAGAERLLDIRVPT